MTGSPSSATATVTSTAVTGQPATTPITPGAHQDGADFYGLFAAIAIIIGAIIVVRVAFRRPPGPQPTRETPARESPAEETDRSSGDPP
ncbi:MAG: hypothetical protein M3063_02235 [Actinomycetota bacterium]|nr:hypothetical protein [Actinomycetota bacterium]